jgi:hypothetical protein
MSLFARIVFVGLAYKEKCMELLTRPRLSSLPQDAWSSYMLISLVHHLMKVLEERSIASSSLMTIHAIVGYSSSSTRV